MLKLTGSKLALWLYSSKKGHLPRLVGQRNMSNGMDSIKKSKN